MKTIVRKKYLDRIIELNGTPDIKIITGIRRSGKSKLMQAYMEHLKTNCENINIIFIDFMDLEFEEIKEYHALHSYVEQHYAEGKTNYLFISRHFPRKGTTNMLAELRNTKQQSRHCLKDWDLSICLTIAMN